MSFVFAKKIKLNQARPAKPAHRRIPIGNSQRPAPYPCQPKTACVCGGGCPRCAPFIQAKRTIGQAEDTYEQEADRAADLVMPTPDFQRAPS